MSAESVAACPECDRAGGSVYERSRADPAWVCYNCGAEFATPTWRGPRSGPYQHRGPSAAALETPDALFATVEVGEKVAITETDSGGGYVIDFAIVAIQERTVWDVPFGADWCTATLTLSVDATRPTHEAHITADGRVELYSDQGANGPTQVAVVTGVERAGEVRQHAKLQLIGDGVEMPDGDDSWRSVRRRSS